MHGNTQLTNMQLSLRQLLQNLKQYAGDAKVASGFHFDCGNP
jgi:hypothetical protein